MGIKAISQPRFEALCFMRRAGAKMFAQEREWYADTQENVLGTVLLDNIDHDWSYVVLGRDEIARFRAIDQGINHRTVDEARAELHKKMMEYVVTSESVYPQGVPLTISWTRLLPYSTRPLDRRGRRSSLLRQLCASSLCDHPVIPQLV